MTSLAMFYPLFIHLSFNNWIELNNYQVELINFQESMVNILKIVINYFYKRRKVLLKVLLKL